MLPIRMFHSRIRRSADPRRAASDAGDARPGRRPSARRMRGLGSQKGLTMIEILVSVVLVGILVIPIFDGFVRGRVFVSRRSEKRMAVRLVERKLEQLLAAGYGASGDDTDVSSVNMTSGTHPTDPAILVNTRGDDDPSNDVTGNLRWEVTAISSFDGVDIKIVEATLAWPASAPRDSVTLSVIVGG